MKVSELLSATTVGSSRVLSAYAAILGVILWTGTPPKDIPAISFLKASHVETYSIALVLLVFMALAHALNFRNDTLVHKEARWRKEADEHKEGADIVARPNPGREEFHQIEELEEWPDVVGEMYKEAGVAYEAANRSKRDLTVFNDVIVFGMHAIIPFGLALVSGIWLAKEIFACMNATCA